MIDEAELRLWAAIQRGESWAIAFALRTLGRDRGYAERVTQEVGGNVLHLHVWTEQLQQARQDLEAKRLEHKKRLTLPEGLPPPRVDSD